MWKKRLRSVIDNGKAGANPVELAKDNVFLQGNGCTGRQFNRRARQCGL